MAIIQGFMLLAAGLVLAVLSSVSAAQAQTPPSAGEIAGYTGLHLAAYQGDVAAIERLTSQGVDIEARDGSNRTAVHIAAFARKPEAIAALGSGKKFASIDEAMLAYDKGVVDIQAPIWVRMPGKVQGQNDRNVRELAPAADGSPRMLLETSIGRIIFNSALLGPMQFRNRNVPKKGLQEIIADCYKYYTNLANLSEEDLDTVRAMYPNVQSRDEMARIYGSERTADQADKIKALGFKYATGGGMTASGAQPPLGLPWRKLSRVTVGRSSAPSPSRRPPSRRAPTTPRRSIGSASRTSPSETRSAPSSPSRRSFRKTPSHSTASCCSPAPTAARTKRAKRRSCWTRRFWASPTRSPCAV